jgi:hypothetical protein
MNRLQSLEGKENEAIRKIAHAAIGDTPRLFNGYLVYQL